MGRRSVLLIFSLLVLTTPMVFQNCTRSIHSIDESLLASSSGCQAILEASFKQTYHVFTQSRCNSCHVFGGRGKGAFADRGAAQAWAAFQLVGYAKLEEFALDPTHKSPFTGPQNQADMDQYKEQWLLALEEKARCDTENGGTGDTGQLQEDVGPRIRTTNQAIGLTNVGQSVTLTWNLETDLSADEGKEVPNLPGAELTVDVTLTEILGELFYNVTNPRIRNSTVDINVQSIRTLINEDFVSGETTFKFVNRNLFAETDSLLSAGTFVAPAVDTASDTLQLSFLELVEVDLPEPDPGPEVIIVENSQTVTEDAQTSVSFTVRLARNPVISTIVRVDVNEGQTNGRMRRGPRSEAEPYDFFDWDFTLGTVQDPTNGLTLVFVPDAPLEQTIDIRISNDDRDDAAAERVRFDITNIENGVEGANTNFTLTVNDDDDPVSNPFIETYSKLMTGNGVLRQRCLECHNTVRKEGGYDITDYETMVSSNKGILVPGNPTDSEMYKRLRATNSGRMPRDQALDPDEQADIEDWITRNALNN